MAERTIRARTADGDMDCFLAEPAGAGRGAAVVVLMEAFGVNAHVRDVCGRLAKEGYAAIAPDLYHRAGRGLEYGYGDFAKLRPVYASLTNGGVTTDIAAAIEAVRGVPGVDRRRVGAVGFCLGGFAAFLAACRTGVAAAACFYGGGIATERPGYALRPPLEEADRIEAPLLLLYGAKDEHIPAAEREAIRAKLTAAKKAHEVVVYEGADHGFFCDERSSYEPNAAADAWKKTLKLLEKTIGSAR